MKKLIFALAAMASVVTLQAQTGQGRLFINGQFTVSSQSFEADDDFKNTEFAITPSIGYFIADKFALGLGIGYEGQRTDDVDGNVRRSITSGGVIVAPFGRYYVPTAGDKFHFFAQTRLRLGFGNTKNETRTQSSSVTVESRRYQNIDFAISPGFAYFPSDHWSVELAFRGFYINSNNPEGNDNNSTTVGLGVNSLDPSLGVSYFF